jgi:hypothetical protein
MSEERKKILKMLAEGKITAEEADQLLEALASGRAEKQPDPGQSKEKAKDPKFLRVVVASSKPGKENVNIKIPLEMIRAGVKLGGLLPEKAREKINTKLIELKDRGMNVSVDDLNAESLNAVIQALTEMRIEIDEPDEKVSIFCE